MVIVSCTAATACVSGPIIDKTKTQLYVYNYDGGVGTRWLDNIVAEFTEKYAGVSFEEGKTGVQVEVSRGKDNLQALASSAYNVIFTEQVMYNSMISSNLVLDITDIVKEQTLSEVSDGADTKTIEDKLSPSQRAAFTALKGGYYAIPHYEVYTGVVYDAALFAKKGWYFKSGGGWTREANERSVGPDGVRDTYDDGLPSSYEEFFNLLTRIANEPNVPFVWCGEYINYINDLLPGAWASYSGADEFMLNVNFSSETQGTQARIVTGFNGNTPVVESVTITPENGYLMSQSAGKYYAYTILEKILSNSSYYSDKINETLSHLDTQREFIYSDLENNSIAMMIEGSYWYNEAAQAFKTSENRWKENAKNRDFRWMPLPQLVTGSMTEGNGRKNAIVDTLSSFAFINANIKDNPAQVKLAKTFLQYCYTDKALTDFTVETGNAKALTYTIDDDTVASMNKYYQNLYEVRQQSDVVYPYSDSPIFVDGQSKFTFDIGSTVWSAEVNRSPYVNYYTANKKGVSAKDYFMGGYTTQASWNASFGKYFT
jgi:hypothetical protein